MGKQVKSLPAMQKTEETWILFLDQEAPLASQSSTIAWVIPWTEEPSGL